MSDEIIYRELDNILLSTEDKLNNLTQNYESILEVEKEISKSDFIDWGSLAKKINVYESGKFKIDLLREVRVNIDLCEKLFEKQTPYEAVKILKQMSENNSDVLILGELLIKMIDDNRFIIDDCGHIIYSVIEDFQNNSQKQFQFFADYFSTLNSVLSNYKGEIPETNSLNSKEIITVFLFKKIIHTIINPFFNSIKDEMSLEKELIDFYDTFIKYLSKSLNHTFELISSCLSNRSSVNKIMCFILKNITTQLNLIFSKHSNFINVVTKSPENFHIIIKQISTFNKTIYREYSYNMFKEVLLSDLFIDEVHNENLGDFIQAQKSFTTLFMKNHLKERLSETIEKGEFNTEEIFDMIKMIVKDNLQVMICFKNNSLFMEYANEQNFYYSLKEILNIFRNSYNEQIQIFSSKQNISKKKVIFILDLIIKLLIFINKLYKKLENGVEDSIIKEAINKHTSQIITDVNQMMSNYNLIIVKELRTNGFDDLINLFTYEKLVKLEESKINEIANKIMAQFKTLFSDLEGTKASIETENYFFNSFLHIIIGKIIEECEKSLKKVPKSKYFDTLTNKTLKIIDQLTSRYTINQNTLTSVNKLLKNLKNCFSSLNMNKI